MSVHDFTQGAYGHDVVFYPRPGALYGTVHGWGSGVEVGDVLIFNHRGAVLCFKVQRIKYLPQAENHFYASVEYAPAFIEDLVSLDGAYLAS
jgi:hypothetical protein